MSYLRVCEDVGSTPVELPAEDDDTLPVSTLQAQFPDAIGLKYLPDENSNIFRGIRCIDGKLKPPREGWDGLTLYCVYSPDHKRKSEDSTMEFSNNSVKKPRTSREVKCSDLIVLGLNFSTTNDSLKQYFEDKFGPLLMALVKIDMNSKRSKGFGFVRFVKYEDQVKALSARKHEIDGRWVTIKPPFAKEGAEPALPSKVFVSRLSPSMTKEDIEEYFSKYGEIGDTFLPRPFRGFAFLTFVTPEAADQACEEEPHIIKGVSVSVVHASEQQKKDRFRGRDGGRGGSSYYASSFSRGSQDRFHEGPPPPRYGSSRGSYHSYSSRDSYNDYGSRGDYGSSGSAASELSKALAVALRNPATVSSLLNNLGGMKKEPGGGSQGGHDYGRDYSSKEFDSSSSDYKDYSYSKDRTYNSYSGDDNYGSSSNGRGKYGGGSGGSLRY